MKKSIVHYVVITLALMLNACSDDDSPTEPAGDYENGYFVVNEGPFQNGSGTITFVGDDGSVRQNVYKTVNGEDLGNIVNSMYITDGKGYIVVNNSNKVVVVNRYTMEKEAVIQGNDIESPRCFTAANGKGYISNWGDPFNAEDDYVAVIDLATNLVLEKIAVGEGPENMLTDADRVFVCLEGGYGQNDQVAVINTNDDSVITNLTVGYVPNSMAIDNSGDIWVLCGGKPAWTGAQTPGALFKIDPMSTALTGFEFNFSDHPTSLNTENGNLYYALDGKVFQMNKDDIALPTEALPGLDGVFYAMNVRAGELFATDAGDYASEGNLKVYSIGSGSLLETIPAGIIPGQVVFP